MTGNPLKAKILTLATALVACIILPKTGYAQSSQLVVANYAASTQLANVGEGIFSAPSHRKMLWKNLRRCITHSPANNCAFFDCVLYPASRRSIF